MAAAAAGVTPATARKVLASTTSALLSSSPALRRRSLSCSAASAATAPRIAQQPPDLLRWVQREGGFVHPALRVSDHPEYGLGVSATAADGVIPPGAVLIDLPGRIPLRLRRPADAADAVLMQLADQVPEELWAMRLGLRLLQERTKFDSFWWPYIANLPETFTVPIFFPGEDIKNLQYAPLLHQINKRCRFLLEFEKEVKQKLGTVPSGDHPFCGQDVHSSSLGWAMSAASSRAFRLHGEIPMLLPLVDMCNHSFSPNARIVQDGDVESPDMSVKVIAETQIDQNAAVTLNYGCYPNDFYLLDYGFVVTSNPYDQVELSYDGNLLDAASMAAGVSNPNFSTPAKWQQEILSQLNLHGEGAILKVSLGGPDIVDGRLLAALRVLLAADPEAVGKHDLKTLMSLSAKAPLGPTVEASAFRTVLALCAIALQHFHTKIMDDQAILKGEPPLTTELAVQFRLQKKLMLVDIMQNLSRRIKTLSPEKSTA
ncbi:actin-histidine N-methyltransferase [Hordeum vulgare subsp. vulgare]|uniref:SET domain-containing protein n=1 Tax=Hordeum vulgare subsp. vulgare TaxID=112509 RepID=A0A8I6XWV8_HORVV|nr:actin-histidine N-methyltransferase [Hordeum vulgare subsp. vulgare]